MTSIATNNIQDLEDIIGKYNTELNNYSEEILFKILLDLNNYINNYYYLNTQLHDTNFNLYFSKLKQNFTKFMYKTINSYKIQIKKPILLFYYKKFIQNKKIENNDILIQLLMKSPSRDISGINQITLLTSPNPDGQSFSCKHDCFYCPNEPAHKGNNFTPQPRSYLYKEPAVQRANRNNFDAFNQTQDRLNSLLSCGHKCDKLEFILEGGTFTEYPKIFENLL